VPQLAGTGSGAWRRPPRPDEGAVAADRRHPPGEGPNDLDLRADLGQFLGDGRRMSTPIG
jgi:hypothetical protein